VVASRFAMEWVPPRSDGRPTAAQCPTRFSLATAPAVGCGVVEGALAPRDHLPAPSPARTCRSRLMSTLSCASCSAGTEPQADHPLGHRPRSAECGPQSARGRGRGAGPARSSRCRPDRETEPTRRETPAYAGAPTTSVAASRVVTSAVQLAAFSAWLAGYRRRGGEALKLLRMILYRAIDDNRLKVNAAARVDSPRTKRQRVRVLKPDEIARVVDALPERWRAFVLLGAYGSLRWSARRSEEGRHRRRGPHCASR
jgi:hypothetical protein